jgi:hypothetical protein
MLRIARSFSINPATISMGGGTFSLPVGWDYGR